MASTTVESGSHWLKYQCGINAATGETSITFKRTDWDLGSEHLVGKTFSEIIPLLVKESRFHPTMFNPGPKIGNYHGGIISTNFFIYTVHPHEREGVQRLTNSDNDAENWVGVEVGPNGNMIGFNPLEDIPQKGVGIGWGSEVMLNNLTAPGSCGGFAHFPMLDVIKAPSEQNVEHLISEVKRRTGLEKFLIIKSSENGMMVLGVELVDKDQLLCFWNNAELMNHYETSQDVWVDTRWKARSQQNHRADLGLPNGKQVCGILRTNAIPPYKPLEPTVIAASF